MIGDLNDRTGSRSNDPKTDLVVGCHGERVVNDNGERLIHLIYVNSKHLGL